MTRSRLAVVVALALVGSAVPAWAQRGGGGGGRGGAGLGGGGQGGGGLGGGGLGGGGQGGISIDAEGVLRPSKGKAGKRILTAPKLREELAARSELRRVSLKQLDRELRSQQSAGTELPPELALLAGLVRIEYVIFDKENQDILIAGPAEGWTIGADGREIGESTRRPVLHLADLATALRCVLAGDGEVRCSIDPQQRGLAAMQQYKYDWTTKRDVAEEMRREVMDRLGLQLVRVSGVPSGSRFSLVLIEADYRMKRMALGLEKVLGLTSHLDTLVDLAEHGQSRPTLARWWFTPWYEPVLTSPDRAVFKLRGQALKVLNEEVFVEANGARRGSGQSNPEWDRFSVSFTKLLPSLETTVPAFADLHNLFDLMMVAGLIRHEQHGDWLNGSALLDAELLPITTGRQPERAEPVVTYRLHQKSEAGRRKAFTTIAFGGVSMRPSDVLTGRPMEPDQSGVLVKLLPSNPPGAGRSADAGSPARVRSTSATATTTTATSPLAGISARTAVATSNPTARWWIDLPSIDPLDRK